MALLTKKNGEYPEAIRLYIRILEEQVDLIQFKKEVFVVHMARNAPSLVNYKSGKFHIDRDWKAKL